MIDVSEAKSLIKQHITTLNPVKLAIQKAQHHILAEDLYATCDIPAFRQSSMDGYAFRFEDRNLPLQICGEMAAGTSQLLTITAGQAARIFTGGPLPEGADTVVMQEKISLQDEKIIIQDERLQMGANVRNIGSEIQNRALAMQKGNPLTPPAIGFLAGIGITELMVYPMPKIVLIVTGKELCSPGQPLKFGQVYESNSFAIKAALSQFGIFETEVIQADDDLQVLTSLLKKALIDNDMVLLTGGVSVGDYDFVIEATRLSQVKQVFHKVKQKPGKPLYFGMLDKKPVFGLPGNPSSVLNCFYNYVLPALCQMTLKTNPVKQITAKLSHDHQKAAGLTHFLKGTYHDGFATALNAQESYRLSSFAHANCLLYLEEDQQNFKQNETINIFLLPE
jgi:molybdopterin molybdotransferase